MATAIELDATIVVRESTSGAVYAHPWVDATLASRATSVERALAEQERFLTRYLKRQSAATLASYALPREARLLEVPVLLSRADLPRRVAITEPVTVPCIVVPHDGAFWVHVLPLGTVAYFETDEDLVGTVSEAARKAARVRGLTASELLARLPAERHRLHQLSLSIEREDADDAGARAQARRERARSRQVAASETLLHEVGTSLQALHARGRQPDVLGRDAEIEALAGLLGGEHRSSVVIVGPEMAGKSAVMHGLVARSLHGGEDLLGGRMVFATSGARIVAGQSGFGELEQRIADVMRSVEALDAIIYFDNLGDLLSGRPGSIEDLVSSMLPFVTQDRVRLVGELTPEQVSHYEKMHVGFMASLSRVTVEPIDKEASRPILRARARHVAKREPHRPSLSDAAVGPLLDLCERYLAYEAFPGKAVRLHDELRAIHEAEVTESGDPKPIGPPEVYAAFSARSGIPLFLLKDDRAVKLEEIERFFARRVIGQEEAVRRVAETVCMVKANLQPPGKPLANFLFIGPTGVGKTEVAKTLALFLFGSSDRMVRFDMSEYMDPLAAERLIRGTQREEGELTRRVRQQPFCVVLLDEIEKAHGAVFDLLLQVCGEGRLSDARGRTTWFNNAIIIMTSNLGAAHRRPDAGFAGTSSDAPEAIAAYYLEQVDKHFRPEFVGRIDRVIPFSALQRSEVSAVAEIALRKVLDRDGLLGRGTTLAVSKAALDGLAHAGYSAAYGARALRRHLETTLVGPVSAVMAKHASVLDGAQLQVCRPDEALPEPGEGFTREAEASATDLSIAVHRPLTTQRRQAVHDLGVISALRRAADRCMHGPDVEAIRERLDYLVADLAGSKRTPEKGMIAALAAERGRLQGMLAEAEEPVAALCDAEELAMAAMLEGADAGLFTQDAREVFARFERAFVRLLTGFAGHDAITLFARSTGGRRVHDFLALLQAAARERGWDVTLHRAGDPEHEGDWPAGRYGPPRTLGWWKEKRESETRKERVHWSAVLVRVRGPQAGALLEHELGTWTFSEDGRTDTLELVPMSDEYAIPAATLNPQTPPKDDPYVLPEARKPEELRRLQAHRLWVRDAERWTLSLPLGDTFSFGDITDLAPVLERVQFSARAASALQQDD